MKIRFARDTPEEVSRVTEIVNRAYREVRCYSRADPRPRRPRPRLEAPWRSSPRSPSSIRPRRKATGPQRSGS